MFVLSTTKNIYFYLAACHNCGLVPETSCEAFNSYLDRGLLTGTIENKNMGFLNN